MAKDRFRTLAAYTIHGWDGEAVIDYKLLMQSLAQTEPQQRTTSLGNEMVAFTEISERDGVYGLEVASGVEGDPAILYDPATGQATEVDLGRRISATLTSAFVNPDTRILALERKRPGLSASALERALALMSRELGIYEGLRISLKPVASDSFLTELATFDRIRLASVVIGRPNKNWHESAAELSGYAAESNGERVTVEMAARRAQSLDHDSGIVQDIKTLATDRLSPLENAKITGTRHGEGKETTISLGKHQEKAEVKTQAGDSRATIRAKLFDVAVRAIGRWSD